MSATIVTALYDIGRGSLSGKDTYRPFSNYLAWMKKLLLINAPMVIYVPEEYRSYILENRPKQYATKIITREFTELSAYKYYNKIQSTIDSMKQKANPMPHNYISCPEFNTAKYQVIIYSKFDFLKEVAIENPFDSEYFMWLDAGIFRTPLEFNPENVWPDPYKIRCLGDKFLIPDHGIDRNRKNLDKADFMKGHNNLICAYILGGSKTAILNIHKIFWNEVDILLNLGVTNNEQHILYIMFFEHPELFYVWKLTKYPGIPSPTNERMIPTELAIGTNFPVGYPKDQKIKVFAVATQNIPDNKIQKWVNTANYYGYDYEILGRNQKWEGFGTKVKLFYDAISKTSSEYVLIVDCTDVFFCGPPEELYRKFIDNHDSKGTHFLCSGETNLYYDKGKYCVKIMKDYFDGCKRSSQRYPNSGFIIGRKQNMLEYFEKSIHYKDDQAALYDHLFKNKINDIDYKTSLVGTIINLPDSINNFEYCPAKNRYKNNISGEYPVVFHFAGHNFYHMNKIYYEVIPKYAMLSYDNAFVENNSENNYAGFWFLIIVIIILALLVTGYYLMQ